MEENREIELAVEAGTGASFVDHYFQGWQSIHLKIKNNDVVEYEFGVTKGIDKNNIKLSFPIQERILASFSDDDLINEINRRDPAHQLLRKAMCEAEKEERRPLANMIKENWKPDWKLVMYSAVDLPLWKCAGANPTPEWQENKFYCQDDRVVYNDNIWVSLYDGNNDKPGNSLSWIGEKLK